MNDEVTDGSRIGASLIMYAAIIGIAIIAFFAIKAFVGNGTQSMSAEAQSVRNSMYTDYDEKNVTGATVKNALTTFKGQDLMLLVHTLSEGDKGGTYLGAVNRYRSAQNTVRTVLTGANYQKVVKVKGYASDSNMGIDTDNGSDGQGAYFINYGAVAADSTDVTASKSPYGFFYDSGYASDKSTGATLHNTVTKYTEKKESPEYIGDDTLFEAHLIRTHAGEVSGIIFSQKYRQ